MCNRVSFFASAERGQSMYDEWVENEPDRFYAYIKRSSDGVWIGDVNFHYTPEKD